MNRKTTLAVDVTPPKRPDDLACDAEDDWDESTNAAYELALLLCDEDWSDESELPQTD
jgi:hypothetical protein